MCDRFALNDTENYTWRQNKVLSVNFLPDSDYPAIASNNKWCSKTAYISGSVFEN